MCYCLRRIVAPSTKLFVDGFLNKIKNPEQELCMSRTKFSCEYYYFNQQLRLDLDKHLSHVPNIKPAGIMS